MRREAVHVVARWPLDEPAWVRTGTHDGRDQGTSILEHIAHGLLDAGRKRRNRRPLAWLDSGGPLDDVRQGCILTGFPTRSVRVAHDATDDELRQALRDIHVSAPTNETKINPTAGPSFQGGWIGFLGYEAVRALEPVRPAAVQDVHVPLASWAWHDTWVRYDDQARILSLETRLDDDVHIDDRGHELPSRDAWRHWVEEALRAPFDHTTPMWVPPESLRPLARRGPTQGDDHTQDYGRSLPRQQFTKAVRVIQRAIRDGEVFQANLAQRLSHPHTCDPFRIHILVRRRNPSPFAAYLEEDWGSLICNSPERLVSVQQGTAAGEARSVRVRPIAGTRRRGSDAVEDAGLARELLGSEKERAEHTMLVDLARNDVGRVCIPGSVRVDGYQRIEHYSHVHHLVSDIVGRARDDLDLTTLLRALFPGGTITGAPKLRSIELIDSVEPVARGPYTGTLGYVSAQGDIDLNIMIRTLVACENTIHGYAGAGIVADSEAEAEYEETLHKAAALLDAFAAAEHEHMTDHGSMQPRTVMP